MNGTELLNRRILKMSLKDLTILEPDSYLTGMEKAVWWELMTHVSVLLDNFDDNTKILMNE